MTNKVKNCVVCGTITVKNPLKHWFAGPKCDTCYRREQYNKPNSKKKQYEKRYRFENKEKIRNKTAIYVLWRSKVDIDFKIKRDLRRRLSEAINNNQKSGSAVKDLGCSIVELKQHLESKFISGMNWGNHTLNGWHIDHIKPLDSFDLTNREELKKACHYTNLQPLWAKDNRCKSDKY